MELHPEALKLVDDKGPALIGAESVDWLAPDCQGELFIIILPDNNSRGARAEFAYAAPAKGRIHAIAPWNASEDDVFDERLEWGREIGNVSFAVGKK